MALIKCTHCGASLKVASATPGKKFKCPKCAKVFAVEAEKEPEVEEPVEQEEEREEEEAPKPKKPAKPVKKVEEEEEEPAEKEETEDEDEAPKTKGKPSATPAKKGDGDAPKKKGSMAFLLIILGIVLLFCCGGVGYSLWEFQETLKDMVGMGKTPAKKIDSGANKPKGQGNDDDKDKEKPAPTPDFTAAPNELAEEFRKDFRGADKKYMSKLVECTGEVKGIAFLGADRKLAVTIAGGKVGGKDFRLNFAVKADADTQVIYRLSTGQKIKAVGQYFSHVGEDISFRNSMLSEVSKSTIKEVTSVNLVAEFEKDSGAADTTYRGKAFLVAGEVLDVSKAKDGQTFATLSGSEKTKVKIAAVAEELGKLQVGKMAVIRVEDFAHNVQQNTIYLTRAAVTDLEAGKTP